MDKELIAGRFGKAMPSYDNEAIVQQQIADKMVSLLRRHITSSCGKVVEVGCGTGLFTRFLLRDFCPDELLLNDICPDMGNALHNYLSDKVKFCAGDAECIDFPCNQDLIVSCSALQWFVSPERFFNRCRNYLSGNGYLAFSTFGCENMKEVKSITGNSLPYRSKEELEQILTANYQLIYSGEETVTLHFESPLEVLRHLKCTGVTAIRGQSWTKRDLVDFCNQYNEKFNNGRTVCLTYHPIYIIVKKENDEQ